jgi:hypothetical protein
MKELSDMTPEELVAEATVQHGRIDAAQARAGSVFKELYSRIPQDEAPPVVVEPPIVEPPVVTPPKPGLDHNAIISFVMNAVPTEEGLRAEMGMLTKMATVADYGNGWPQDWKVTDGEVHVRKLWDGSYTDTNFETQGFLRVLNGGGGTPYGYIDSLAFEHCEWVNVCRWAMRLHGIRSGFKLSKSIIRDVRKEHGNYLSVCGGGSGPAVQVSDVVYRNIGSQSVQIVQRDQFSDNFTPSFLAETPNPEADFVPGGDLIFDRIAVLDGAKEEGDRESFDFSFFRSRNDIGMADILIDDRVQPVSRGFQMAQGYHGLDDPFERILTTTRFVWRSGKSLQEAGSYQNMSRVQLFDGVIDVPEGQGAVLRFTGCSDDIFIKNLTSLRAKVRVEIDGVDAGFVDDWDGYR